MRITPACAGKSLQLCVSCHWQRDHPRVCGEKFTAAHQIRRAVGSPPRVRGKEFQRLPEGGLHRITPACAGKRQKVKNQKALSKDHPRVCGEKLCSSWNSGMDLESPPRVRGKDIADEITKD